MLNVYICIEVMFKDTRTKAYLRDRILGGAYFNEGVCDVNKTITSFFSDQTIFEESSLQFDHELDEWSNTNETLQISFDHAKIM